MLLTFEFYSTYFIKKMEYSIRFRLDIKKNVYVSKKAVNTEPYYQISAIIRVNRQQEIHYFTGYSAQRSAWFGNRNEASRGDGNRSFGIHKNCTAKKRTRIVQYAEVNRTLDLIGAKLLSLSQKVETISKEELVTVLDKEIGKTPKKESQDTPHAEESAHEQNPFWTLAALFCKDATVSQGRNNTRINAMNHLKNFERWRKKEISFAICDAKLLTDFQCYLQNDEGQIGACRNPMHRTRKKNRNSISKIMTVAKHFFKWCRKQYGVTEYGNIADYTVPTAMYGDPVTLTQEEKRQLLECELKDTELSYIRDLFYFQCSIGCRVSDFFNLKYRNLIEENGVTCIHYCPQKTKEVTAVECRIPLSPKALDILNRHRIEEPTPYTPLFLFPKNKQTYNTQLKRVFRTAGLTRIVTTYNAYGEAEYKPLYELAKSKFARSCFIDVLVGKGVTDSIIATMSGHTAGSKAFHRYHNSMKHEQQNQAVMLLD